MSYKLRPYQIDLKNKIYTALSEGFKTPLVISPTGSGKTVTMCSVAHDFASGTATGQVLPVVISVHRKELVSQICLTLARADIKHNIIAPRNVILNIIDNQRRAVKKQLYDYKSPITVVSVDTLNARVAHHEKWCKSIKVWIQDEAAHVLKTNKWGKAIGYFKDSIGIGFTATPLRLDKKGLGSHADGVFDTLIQGPTVKWLIQNGFLSKYKMVVPPGDYEKHLKEKKNSSDYTTEEMRKASQESHIIGDVVQNYLKYAKGKKAMVFASDIKTANDYESEFIKCGVKAKTLTGTTEDKVRNLYVRKFSEEDLEVLINVDLFDEGFDCLDSATEILTPDGWKGIDDLKSLSKCYAWDSKSFRIKEVKILKKGIRKLKKDEKMLHVVSQHTDIRVTEKHRIYWRSKDYYTDDFMSSNVSISTAEEMFHYNKPFSIPLNGEMDFKGIDLSDDEIKLMGWALTDGYIDKHLALIIDQCKPWFVIKIRDLLNRLGFKYSENVRKKENLKGYGAQFDRHVFRISSLEKRWQQIRHLYSKNLHDDLHKMTINQFKILWDSMMDGNGSRQTGKNGKLCTSRKKHADFFTHMASLRGYAMMYGNYLTKNNVLIYNLGMRDKKYIQLTKRDKRGAKFTLEKPEHPELVWCIQNKLGTIITRRNGKIAILGNCPGVECVIHARPTKSLGKYMQINGRGLRPMQGKPYALIIDHVGNIKRHGLPDDRRVWTLDRIIKHRENINLIRICSNDTCNTPYDKTLETCPYCGTDYIKMFNRQPGMTARKALEQVEGDLMLLDPDTIRELEFEAYLVSPDELANKVAYAAGPAAGIRAAKNQRERIETQKQLAEVISLWAGKMKHHGYTDRQIHKRFYLTFDMSITGALSRPKVDMEQTIKEVKNEIGE